MKHLFCVFARVLFKNPGRTWALLWCIRLLTGKNNEWTKKKTRLKTNGIIQYDLFELRKIIH